MQLLNLNEYGFIPKRPSLFKRRKKSVKLISDYNFMKDNYNIMKIKIVSKGEQLIYTKSSVVFKNIFYRN